MPPPTTRSPDGSHDCYLVGCQESLDGQRLRTPPKPDPVEVRIVV